MATIGIRASLPDSQQLCSAAADLAKKLQLPDAQHQPERFDMLLVVADHHLELHWQGAAEGGDDDAAAAPPGRKLNPVCIDLEQIDGLSPWGRSLRQPLARAMGITKGNRYRPMILDATAGYGEDAWLLASLGCTVTAIERCGPIAAMLDDALRRAASSSPQIAQRITLHSGDARDVLRQLATRQARDEDDALQPEVVYLDPMFPPSGKAARQRKEMWMLRQLAGHDDDSSELFELALAVAQRRVVVKRSLHAPPIAGKPAATHKGKAHRFDVYPWK